MWCPACAWVIQTALKKQEGVLSATCDFATDRLRCRYDPVVTGPDRIAAVVTRLGYAIAADDEKRSAARRKAEFVRLAICAFLSANTMMLSFAVYTGFFSSLETEAVRAIAWPVAVLTTVVMVYGGAPIWPRAVSGVVSGAPGMETLVAIGAGSAYLYSLANLFSDSIHLYFDTASMLITLVLLGKTLEGRAMDRVRRDLADLLILRAAKVKIVTGENPQGRYVSSDQLAPGDRFRVGPGEIVAADGRIIEGQGRLDESTLTGEARPIARQVQDGVRSGTRLVQGDILVQADTGAADSTFGQMSAILETALSRKTRIEGYTDKVLRGFVPAVVLAALAAGIGWHLAGRDLETVIVRAITVLVISCPCALGIAIPLARVAAVARAGRQGICVRRFAAFEQAPRITTVVFDKTGTLTEGRWQVLGIEPAGGFDRRTVVALAAGLENGSNHAIAGTILALASREGVAPAPVKAVTAFANGIAGNWRNRPVKIGSHGFAGAPRATSDKPAPGGSTVYLSVNGHPAATFIFGDRLRPDAHATVAALQRQGVPVCLVSGDGQEATSRMAEAAGIDQAIGDMRPADKAAFVKSLQDNNDEVAMVGDGLNDSLALAQSDLAVSLYSGAALAQEAADVTLMAGSPGQLLAFFDLARRTNAVVRQNLVGALVYNTIGIPIAAAGLLTPIWAVIAMLASSLTVIGNTLRLVTSVKTDSGAPTGLDPSSP